MVTSSPARFCALSCHHDQLGVFARLLMASTYNPFSQYSRLERPSESVHWHTRNVPANLGQWYVERMGRPHSKRVGWVPRFKCTGQQVSILVHGPVPLLQAVWPVHIYIWMGTSKWTKMAQPGVRSKCLGQPHVQSVWAECYLSRALANGSPY